MMKRYYYFIAFALCCFHIVRAQNNMSIRTVKEGLFIPWEIIYGPDDHLWFTQKDGYVCRLEPQSGNMDTVYYEPQTVIRGEGGMLGLALHPQYPAEPYVFLAYLYEDAEGYKERVVRFTYNNNTLINPQILLDEITGANNHNGCRLLIADDKLFITTGDAQNTALAQNTQSLNGKILRINLDGSVPVDNPIPGSPVWSWGHRNPQGLATYNGILYSSEHGPDTDDEINIITAGRNYGWPNVHGYCELPAEIQYCIDSNIAEPIYAWTPTLAVSGLEYYNHPMFPQYANSILLSTLKESKLLQLELNTAGDSIRNVSVVQGLNAGRLRDIAVAPDGRIFVSTSNSNANGTGAREDKILELYDPEMTSILPLTANNDEWIIYPNPAMDMVNISFLDDRLLSSQWNYQIDNIQGQTLQQGALELSTLHVGTLYPGLYFLKLSNEKGTVLFRRLVKW
jgi:glucose/arabinose dehydrogenase